MVIQQPKQIVENFSVRPPPIRWPSFGGRTLMLRVGRQYDIEELVYEDGPLLPVPAPSTPAPLPAPSLRHDATQGRQDRVGFGVCLEVDTAVRSSPFPAPFPFPAPTPLTAHWHALPLYAGVAALRQSMAPSASLISRV